MTTAKLSKPNDMNEETKLTHTTGQPQGLAASVLFAEVLAELDRARTKFPLWPDDPLHALAILQEEVGELQKAVLERCYEFDTSSLTDIHNEGVQVIAMGIRFLDSLMEYQFRRSDQHRQRVLCAACDRGDFQLGHADGCLANR